MNTDKNNLDELFGKLNGQWDIEEPAAGHQDRFLDRLQGRTKKKKFSYVLAVPIAAAILILFGIFINYRPAAEPQNTMADISPQVKETQMYFASVIEKELEKVEKENSPETKQLVQDALLRMQELEKDYDRLTKELLAKGENKKIIHAMITNLQTRISFLEEVLIQIENTKKLKEQYNENYQS